MTLLERYSSIRQRTIDICSPLSVEDHGMQPITDVSPAKWHLAHTTWFFETFILNEHLKGYQLFDDRFPYYFNSYYQTIGERQQRDQRGWLTRPSVKEIYSYRAHVDEAMQELLGDEEKSTSLKDLIEIGLNHEQQHQELLLTDIKFGLGVQPYYPVYSENPVIQDQDLLTEPSKWIELQGGTYTIGHEGDGFAFDNEYAKHEVLLRPFAIASQPVTCGEFIEFIEAGGYVDFNYWHDEAWAWIQDQGAQMPLYWEKVDEKYFHFTLSGRVAIEKNAILQHVNYYEAAAFAAWKGKRLPTEFEWEAAADQFKWGRVWEWTNSAYLPYPGYNKPTGAVGEYNGKFMINQMVLRGASIATSPHHSRKTYRNFFHSHLQWQYSGIRLASDL